MQSYISQLIEQGHRTLSQTLRENHDLTDADKAELAAIEPCLHIKTHVAVIVTVCGECNRTWQHQIGVKLKQLSTQIHQGLIDAETVIAHETDLTDDDKYILRLISTCKHENIEQYTCSCSEKPRYRCMACGKSASSPDVFTRLRG